MASSQQFAVTLNILKEITSPVGILTTANTVGAQRTVSSMSARTDLILLSAHTPGQVQDLALQQVLKDNLCNEFHSLES